MIKSKFSVIIPTMWKSPYIENMVNDVYGKEELINEVIIIDNDPSNRNTNLRSSKIKTLTKGKNIYVNPAWNWGVKESKSEYIIIANDDILISAGKLKQLLNLVVTDVKYNMVVGPHENSFKNVYEQSDKIKLSKTDKDFTYGFGTFMIMKRDTYTIIPDDVLIFHGDVIQHTMNEVFLFEGVLVDTPMSKTLKSDKALHMLARQDHAKSVKYRPYSVNLKKLSDGI